MEKHGIILYYYMSLLGYATVLVKHTNNVLIYLKQREETHTHTHTHKQISFVTGQITHVHSLSESLSPKAFNTARTISLTYKREMRKREVRVK